MLWDSILWTGNSRYQILNMTEEILMFTSAELSVVSEISK